MDSVCEDADQFATASPGLLMFTLFHFNDRGCGRAQAQCSPCISSCSFSNPDALKDHTEVTKRLDFNQQFKGFIIKHYI